MALAPLLAGGYHHLANQAADILAGLPVGPGLSQRFGETEHLGAVVLSYVRMHVRQVGRSLGEPRFDPGLLLRQFSHPCLHGWLVHTVFDGVENPLDAPLNLLKGAAVRFSLRSSLMVLAIGLLRIGAHCDRHRLGRDQLVGETRQHAPIDVVAANSTAIVAGPLAEMTETAVAVVDDDAIFSGATSAGEQA